MSDIPTASTSTASTSSASISLASASTSLASALASTSQIHPHTSRLENQEVDCITTDDSEMSTDDEDKILDEHSNFIEYSPVQSSVDSLDDISWSSSIDSSMSMSLPCGSCGEERSGSEVSGERILLNGSVPEKDNITLPEAEAVETPNSQEKPQSEEKSIEEQNTPILILVQVSQFITETYLNYFGFKSISQSVSN